MNVKIFQITKESKISVKTWIEDVGSLFLRNKSKDLASMDPTRIPENVFQYHQQDDDP